jgi:hypothetical protein
VPMAAELPSTLGICHGAKAASRLWDKAGNRWSGRLPARIVSSFYLGVPNPRKAKLPYVDPKEYSTVVIWMDAGGGVC